MNGASPYSPEDAEQFLMSRAAATYSPIVFVLHIPFAMLPLPLADFVFFAVNVAMLILLAYLSIRMSGVPFNWFDFLAITNLLLMSRPGHITLFTGYFTAEIVIGCVLALHYAHSRPVVSGLGMVLASIKPNFVVPLIIMMLWRRNFQAVVLGIVFCAIAAGAGLGWLGYHKGLDQVVLDIRGGQAELHIDERELPVNTWTRTDLTGMVAKVMNAAPGDTIYLLAMIGLSCIVGPFIYRYAPHEPNQGATGLTALISVLSILVGIYHHSYDCLLLVVPVVGLLFYGSKTMSEVPLFWRNVVTVLCAIPAVNYLSTMMIMNKLGLEKLSFSWQAVTMINGICMTIALAILILVAFRQTPDAPNQSNQASAN